MRLVLTGSAEGARSPAQILSLRSEQLAAVGGWRTVGCSGGVWLPSGAFP
ncbi:MAG TPA: hypothetical protein VEM93_02485 [Actinomycetota bacterium]|nr:hypothetical protein [Actinomycetota bacterium]